MDSVSRGVIISILSVWIVIALTAQFTHNNDTLTLVTPVMLAALGFIGGVKIIRGDKKKDDDEGSDKE